MVGFGKEEKDEMFHKLHALVMNDDLWRRVCPWSLEGNTCEIIFKSSCRKRDR